MDNQNKKAVVNNRLFAVNKTPLSATVDGEGEGAVGDTPLSVTGADDSVGDTPLSVTGADDSVVEGHTSRATPTVRPSESTDPNSLVSQSALHVEKPVSKPQVQPNVLAMS
jgi:hypothetical protein